MINTSLGEHGKERKKKADQRQNTRDKADTAGQRKLLHVKRKKLKEFRRAY